MSFPGCQPRQRCRPSKTTPTGPRSRPRDSLKRCAPWYKDSYGPLVFFFRHLKSSVPGRIFAMVLEKKLRNVFECWRYERLAINIVIGQETRVGQPTQYLVLPRRCIHSMTRLVWKKNIKGSLVEQRESPVVDQYCCPNNAPSNPCTGWSLNLSMKAWLLLLSFILNFPKKQKYIQNHVTQLQFHLQMYQKNITTPLV